MPGREYNRADRNYLLTVIYYRCFRKELATQNSKEGQKGIIDLVFEKTKKTDLGASQQSFEI